MRAAIRPSPHEKAIAIQPSTLPPMPLQIQIVYPLGQILLEMPLETTKKALIHTAAQIKKG
jgi:hypothetical protein